jgi:hypothetical protein
VIRVAALFVASGGVYFGLPGVDPWDERRDARLYAGPFPVVAHPPCERWGRYWSGGPNPLAARRQKGDDGGCFASALAAVRLLGGVLEHPEATHAWAAHGLARPPRAGGWVPADDAGWTCCVEQGQYGHAARKATWLYAAGVELPDLRWGNSGQRLRLDEGPRSKEAAIRMRSDPDFKPRRRLSANERVATPIPFRDLLIEIARSRQ